MRVVTLLNQKGGVGKTSTCYHLAGTIAKDGRRVLLIDNDPQASLTQGLIGPDGMRSLDATRTIASIYRLDEPFPNQVIRKTEISGLDLLPGSTQSKTFNRPDAHLEPRKLRHCIREFLTEVSDHYDYILIDVPPNLHLCSWAALVASRHVIVPMQPEDFGAQGIADVNDSVRTVRDTENGSLAILGYLITMATMSRGIHKFYDEQLRQLYGDLVFNTVIKELASFVEAIGARRPIAQYQPKGAAAKIMRALADELYARLDAAELERGAA